MSGFSPRPRNFNQIKNVPSGSITVKSEWLYMGENWQLLWSANGGTTNSTQKKLFNEVHVQNMSSVEQREMMSTPGKNRQDRAYEIR